MYVGLLKFSETEVRYDISRRKGAAYDNPVLVRVKVSEAGASITVDSTQNQMSIGQAAVFAQALMIGIQIAHDVTNGREVEADLIFDDTSHR